MRLRHAGAIAAALIVAAGAAAAQQKLKFAHVYEVSEPYHTEVVKAAEAIKAATKGKFEIQVFPASALGNEQQINQALPLGTIDMIYTGVAFAGASYKPIAISNAPYMFRDYDHWAKYATTITGRNTRKAISSRNSPRATARRPRTRSWRSPTTARGTRRRTRR